MRIAPLRRLLLIAVTGIASMIAVAGCRNDFDLSAPPLDPPARVAAVSDTRRIEVTWDPVPGAQSYVVYRGTSANAYPTHLVITEPRLVVVQQSNGVAQNEYFRVAASTTTSTDGAGTPTAFVRGQALQPPLHNVVGPVTVLSEPGVPAYGSGVAFMDVDALPPIRFLVVSAAKNGPIVAPGGEHIYFHEVVEGVPLPWIWRVDLDSPMPDFGTTLASTVTHDFHHMPPGQNVTIRLNAFAGDPEVQCGRGVLRHIHSAGYDPPVLGARLLGPDCGSHLGRAVAILEESGDEDAVIAVGVPGTSGLFGSVQLWDVREHAHEIGVYTAATPGTQYGAALAWGVDPRGVRAPWLAIGAPAESGGEGRVYVEGPGLSVALQPLQTSEAIGFGETIATGDLEGDGLVDLLISAVRPGDGSSCIFVVRGVDLETSGVVAPTKCISGPGGAPDKLHFAVGDLNADGYDDVAVEIDEGELRAFLGGSDFNEISTSAPGWRYTDVDGPVNLLAGDVTGDRLADLAVGEIEGGRALFTRGRTNGLQVDAGFVREVALGANVSLSGAFFVAPPSAAPYTCVVDWGDGASQLPFACDAPDLDDPEVVSHVFTKRGRYAVRVTVRGDDSRYGEAITRVDVQ